MLQRSIDSLRIVVFLLDVRPRLGTNRFSARCAVMAKMSKTGKALFPEPSFEFFRGAIGIMLLLVIATAIYFSVHT
jgi:hypothetical protein